MQTIRFVRQVSLIAVLSAAAGILMTVPAAASCTLYASPSGTSTNSGTSSSSPVSLLRASHLAKAGSVVCLMAGTYPVDTPFEIYKSGTSSNWIVYTNYNGGAAVIVPKSGHVTLFLVPVGVRYVEI